MEHFESVTPEIDTIRIFWYCDKLLDIASFMEYNATDVILSVQRVNLPTLQLETYEPQDFTSKWEKHRLDMRNSWWGKMQIGQGAVKYGKGQDTQEYGLYFEYSVAKWHTITNGLNRGCNCYHCDYLQPIIDTLTRLQVQKHLKDKTQDFETHLRNHYQIRRLDLSFNFKTNGKYPISDFIKVLSSCRINNHNTSFYPAEVRGKYEGISWGGGRGSSYKIMFYDKELEQKQYFSVRGIDNSQEIYQAKREFYKKNLDNLKDTLRFEIQFKSKFFLDNFKVDYKYRRDEEMAEKIIKFCEQKWQNKLQEIDQQLGTLNVIETCGENPYITAQNILEDYRRSGGLSNAVVNNMLFFMQQCKDIGWRNVHKLYSKHSFSKKYCKLKQLTNYDVKRECVEEVPIIYISETASYLDKLRQEIYFKLGAYSEVG